MSPIECKQEGPAGARHPTDHRSPRKQSVLRPREHIQIEWIEIDGVRFRYGVRHGQGRPILLFNMLGAHLDLLRPVVRALDDLEVIVPEMPGAGQSPTLSLPRRIAWYARLVAKLLDRLGHDAPINLLGLAWGGSVAQQFALDYPQRVNRLILASSSMGWPSIATRPTILKRLVTGRRYPPAESRRTEVTSRYGGLIRRRPELIARRRGYTRGSSTRGYINHLLSELGWTSAHRLRGLRCPTLLMGGDDDPVVPLINARLLYWLIPKSYLHVVRGGGHLFLLMRANESAAVIKRFINDRRHDGTDSADYNAAPGSASDGGAFTSRRLA